MSLLSYSATVVLVGGGCCVTPELGYTATVI